MPILDSAYVVVIILLALAGIYHQAAGKNKDPVWYVMIDLANTIAELLLFGGYWHKDLIRPLGPAAIVVFVLSVAWSAYSGKYILTFMDQPNFSKKENCEWKRFLVGLMVVIYFPYLWFGGIAALRSLHG